MSRVEFMFELGKLLGDIPYDERIEALTYYESYFEDAGEENEHQVIEELGSPSQVAAIIKADLGLSDTVDSSDLGGEGGFNRHKESGVFGSSDPKEGQGSFGTGGDFGTGTNQESYGEFTERGFTDERFDEKEVPAVKSGPWTNPVLKVALIVAIIIVGFPVIGGLLGGLLGIIVAVFGVFISLVIVGISLILAGVALIIGGFVTLFTAPPAAMLIGGSGLIVLVLGVLATMGSFKLCKIIFPAIIRGIKGIFNWALRRKVV